MSALLFAAAFAAANRIFTAAVQLHLPERSRAGLGSRPYRQVLTNLKDIEYTGEIKVGNQTIRGIIDTGSFELLVFSAQCDTCGEQRVFYDAKKSTTAKKGMLRMMHAFGSGETMSQLAFERIEVGPLVVSKQYFWEVYHAELPILKQNAFQAILGVGPPSTARRSAYEQAQDAKKIQRQVEEKYGHVSPQVLDVALATEALAGERTLLESLDVRSFSVCLKREHGAEGYFTWNDDSFKLHPQNFVRIPVVGKASWGVRLDNVNLQGGSDDKAISLGCTNGCGAIIDSGTSLLTVPSQVADLALEALNKLDADCNDIRKFPHLKFNLGGLELTLPPEAYVGQFYGEMDNLVKRYTILQKLPRQYAGCELLFMTIDADTQFGPLWIFGMPFFREYYTGFDLTDNIWNTQGRSLLVSQQDGHCTPVPVHNESARGPPPPLRRVNFADVRLPEWAMRAVDNGYFGI